MLVLRARNVADALPRGVEMLLVRGQREGSRAGPVLVAPEPVTTVYERPTERVLHSAVRDANPFFHLAEALWMLAGRDDGRFLDEYVRDFSSRFAEPDGSVHGAYGYRWRNWTGCDQLAEVIDKLRRDPADRQAVIQMWDANTDGPNDLRGSWRDRPCNTHAYLRVTESSERSAVLDITVCCRSNDAIWGAYGANAVHFSVLQEYLAAAIGVGVGYYFQVSNNFHVYLSEIERLRGRCEGTFQSVSASDPAMVGTLRDDRYCSHQLAPSPLVSEPETFLAEVEFLIAALESGLEMPTDLDLDNRFLSRTVWPALTAHRAWRQGRLDAAEMLLDTVEAEDWRVACSEWVARRVAARARKLEVAS